MAQVVITFKILPDDVDVNLENLKSKVELEIKQFGGTVGKFESVPVGFGLTAMNVVFICNESLGGTDELEDKIKKIHGIQSCEVTDCRRALG